MLKIISVLYLAVLVPGLVVPAAVPELCPQAQGANGNDTSVRLAHPDYCNVYITCENGVGTMQECATGSNWNDEYAMCVEFNSAADTCTRNNAKRECANHTSALIAHPRLCHRYYDCSRPTPVAFQSFLREYDEECPYPQLFDIYERRCKPFQDAKCGPGRSISKDACDYVRNQCGRGHCEPCSYRLPSCDGFDDGFHENPVKIWSSHYIACQAGRLAGTFGCPREDSRLGTFSPVKKDCVSQWEVPRDHGGLAPSCQDRKPGQYRTEERPDIYFTCPGAEVSYCEDGQVFSESNGRCEPEE